MYMRQIHKWFNNFTISVILVGSFLSLFLYVSLCIFYIHSEIIYLVWLTMGVLIVALIAVFALFVAKKNYFR